MKQCLCYNLNIQIQYRKRGKKMDITALFQLSYGIYYITSHVGEKQAGCVVNTVFQLTANPVTVGVSVAKENQTYEFIKQTGTIGVTILGESADSKMLGKFGYRSGRDIDKFSDTNYHVGVNGDALIDESAVAQLDCTVVQELDMGTHVLFVARVDEAENCENSESPMTYRYYREVKKGQSSKFAPTYVNPVELARMEKEKQK